MKIRIPANIFQQVLFVICIVVPNLYHYELTFAVWSFTAAITIGSRYSEHLVKQIACFAAILITAILVMFFYRYQVYYILRDCTYLIKPIIGLLIGYQLCKKTNRHAFKLIVFAGVAAAMLHLWQLTHAIVFLGARTVIDIRAHAGYFSDFEVYSLVLLLFNKRLGINYKRTTVILFAGILAVSIFMYMARTNFIQFIILWMALKGYLRVNRRSIIVTSSIFLAAVIGYSAILYINPKRNGQGLEALLYKIKIAPTEPFKTRINKEDWKEFHDNYRSYENILTVRQMSAQGTATILFGKGAGSTVDLHREVWLGNEFQRFISILHNGFMTVFLKSGLFGVALFILSIWLLFKRPKANNKEIEQVNMIMLGTGIFMFISSWVFMGLYFTADNKSILIGYLICHREILLKKAKELLLKEQSNQLPE